ncbi:prolyl 4-hydroxylase subunit alpha-2-like [Scaptodrosophila lebanonensis]|uniref:procollagen-proline 4-dioxygenase n=1 Tax=Drosophila lebanonensis TaxID=7225 RepID=A0A6J2TD75_DROLE|nr:prolyl 4-hydroxylase subunit alpha-2-like [Scaptodrosophila lebanonensis]
MQAVNKYASALQHKIDEIQIYIQSLKRGRHDNFQEGVRFVSNSLNAFALIRRLHQDWPAWHTYMKRSVEKDEVQVIEDLLKKAPTVADMNEALLGMHRIEKTYGLEPKDIANGRLQGKQYDIQLFTRDCLTLVKHKIKKEDYGSAIQWFRIALQKKHNPHENIYNEILGAPFNDSIVSTLEPMSSFIVNKGNKTINASQLEQILKSNNNTCTADLQRLLQKLMISNNTQDLDETAPTPYDRGCRGLFPPRTKLSCRYNYTTTPFLRIAPLKMEEISVDPYIVIYHNIVSDKDIDDMHKAAVPKFFNGLAGIPKKNQTEPREIVSRCSWVTNPLPSRERVNRRFIDMTGLDIKGNAEIQVSNYGLGGHFKPHFDYISDDQKEQPDIIELGDRVATINVYTSDVEQGGATVFPNAEVTILPQKGNALFWFNLESDGTPDPRSLHSVCPVIVGSRWTFTKWLREKAQVFTRPCVRR